MQEVRACRVCLDTGAHLISIHSDESELRKVKEIYNVLTGISEWNYISYVCFECKARLIKAHKLRERCIHADRLLSTLVQDFGQITHEALENVDRDLNQLKSGLQIEYNVHSAIEVVRAENTLTLKNEADIEVEIESKIWLMDDVKPEPAIKPCSPDAWRGAEALNDESVDYQSEVDEKFENAARNTIADSDDDTPVSKLTPKKVRVSTPKKARVTTLRKENVDSKTKRVKKNDPPKEKDSTANKTPKSRRRKTSPIPEITDPADVWAKYRSKRQFNTKKYEDYCTVVFMTKEEAKAEIEKRKETNNYLTSTYRCELCYRGFWKEESYSNHMSKHDPATGTMECEVCRVRFETRRRLLHHTAHFHRTKFVCKRCPHYCTNPPLARRHEEWHLGQQYTCKICFMDFKRMSTLHNHVRRLHASELACELCGLSFVGERGMTAHKKKSHRSVKVENLSGPRCLVCEITFASEEAYKRHVVVSPKHKDETANGCRKCGESFATAEELRTHSRTHPRMYPKLYLHKIKNNDVTWPVECEQCKAKIGSSSEYRVHFMKVHPDKNRTHYPVWTTSFMCEECGRCFGNRALLGYHQRKHAGDKPFKCNECDKSFYNRTKLTAHMRMHTGELPYGCRVCGKRYNYKTNLERHMNIHSGLKPYKCDYCGKCFTQNSEKKSHIDYVHHKKPWPKRERTKRNNLV